MGRCPIAAAHPLRCRLHAACQRQQRPKMDNLENGHDGLEFSFGSGVESAFNVVIFHAIPPAANGYGAGNVQSSGERGLSRLIRQRHAVDLEAGAQGQPLHLDPLRAGR